jgi:hypothetical protein
LTPTLLLDLPYTALAYTHKAVVRQLIDKSALPKYRQ